MREDKHKIAVFDRGAGQTAIVMGFAFLGLLSADLLRDKPAHDTPAPTAPIAEQQRKAPAAAALAPSAQSQLTPKQEHPAKSQAKAATTSPAKAPAKPAVMASSQSASQSAAQQNQQPSAPASVAVPQAPASPKRSDSKPKTSPPPKTPPKKAASPSVNRLANAASPYLRQHANNPVDWYPWGPDAFKKAQAENKPIFLSVGYASCHWCHVMARESFSDPEIAALLNQHFVAIKVDRERRPDIDATYMLATEIITKTGGWPNSVFLTPDKKPFHAGGYFPKTEFHALLKEIIEGWNSDKRQQILASADQLAATIHKVMNIRTQHVPVTKALMQQITTDLLKQLDSFHGGFGTAPKFPQAPVLRFLLHRAEMDRDNDALAAVTLTLDNMIAGGIHDQLGGGWHRYAVDNAWHIPHFEKMLYDQAQIASLLLDAYRLTGHPLYADTAQTTLDFVLRELAAPEGGFFAAFDAESLAADGQKREGAFYLWTKEQIAELLPPDDAKLASAAFSITTDGNFEGANVLHFNDTPENHLNSLAKQFALTRAELAKRLRQIRQRLYRARKTRPAPARDEKIIVAWNALMIDTLLRAALILKKPDYLQAAQKAADLILTRMGGEEGQLKRILYQGKTEIKGQLEDYAALANSFLTFYDITGEAKWGARALKLATAIKASFADQAHGDYYMTVSANGFERLKQRADSAIPASNAMVLDLFHRLARRTGNPEHRTTAEKLAAAISGVAISAPLAHAATLTALDRLTRGETGNVKYLGRGKLRATLSPQKQPGHYLLKLELAPGWHINSHAPIEAFLIPTSLDLHHADDDAEIEILYPQAVTRKLAFNDKPLSLYEDTVEIAITLRAQNRRSTRLALTAQACSDQICLEPETVWFVPQ